MRRPVSTYRDESVGAKEKNKKKDYLKKKNNNFKRS